MNLTPISEATTLDVVLWLFTSLLMLAFFGVKINVTVTHKKEGDK